MRSKGEAVKATIIIRMDNAAFEEEPATEISRILRDLAERVELGSGYENLRDINGNTVGTFRIER